MMDKHCTNLMQNTYTKREMNTTLTFCILGRYVHNPSVVQLQQPLLREVLCFHEC